MLGTDNHHLAAGVYLEFDSKYPHMNDTPRDLPKFHNPPVTEVALAVQFESLTALRATQLSLLWQDVFRVRFPKIEEHPPRAPAFEEFGIMRPKTIGVEIEHKFPVQRFWFLNEPETELIQVQQDRFIHNWRKRKGDEPYPHYDSIRDTFMIELEKFRHFLSGEQIGELIPNQCEVTYVNHIVQGEGWDRHGQFDQMFTVWASRYSDEFLPEAETVRFLAQYLIPDSEKKENQIGRLHINAQPGFHIIDNKPMIVLTLTARGRPLSGEGTEGVLSFLNIGREWIVRGFTSITTQDMHKFWERYI